jgi:hypothetical protein
MWCKYCTRAFDGWYYLGTAIIAFFCKGFFSGCSTMLLV